MSKRQESLSSGIVKEEDAMVANAAMRISDSTFSDFLKMNKAKIDSIVPKNPPISKDDEWRTEYFWDEDAGRKTVDEAMGSMVC